MAEQKSHALLYAGLAGGGILLYMFMKGQSASAATAAAATTAATNVAIPAANGYTSTVSATDAGNIAQISAWINSMTSGSAQQKYWQGVLAADQTNSQILADWVDCLDVFSTHGTVGLTTTQQAFWDNLAQGH